MFEVYFDVLVKEMHVPVIGVAVKISTGNLIVLLTSLTAIVFPFDAFFTAHPYLSKVAGAIILMVIVKTIERILTIFFLDRYLPVPFYAPAPTVWHRLKAWRVRRAERRRNALSINQ